MIYKNLLHLTNLADDLIAYVESKEGQDQRYTDSYAALIFLFEIERLFDGAGRGLFSDEEGFDIESVNDQEWKDAQGQIQKNMDKIRSKMKELVNKYGKEEFKLAYEYMRNDDRVETWVKRILQE